MSESEKSDKLILVLKPAIILLMARAASEQSQICEFVSLVVRQCIQVKSGNRFYLQCIMLLVGRVSVSSLTM